VVVLPVQGVPVMSMTRFMGYVGLGVVVIGFGF
jgi:putative acetyltransferase